MATTKTYVHVAKFGVKSAFDSKYKTSLPKVMRAAVEQAINSSSKLTTKTPKDKKAPGFYIDGSLVKLEKSDGGKEIVSAQFRLAVATWPKKSMFAFPSGAAKVPVGNPDRIDGDVEYLVREAVGALMKGKVVKVLEKRAK